MRSARQALTVDNTLDGNDQFMRILIDLDGIKKVTVSAHNQLAVYEEGRGDGHPEADALVHVQLIYGLVGRVGKLTMHVHRTASRFLYPTCFS
jgi:hypothetical protein